MEHFLGGKRSGRPIWGGKKRKEHPFARYTVSAFGFFVLFVCLSFAWEDYSH